MVWSTDQDFWRRLVNLIVKRLHQQDIESKRFTGEQHRKQRKMLNPVFSTAHMRDMSTWPILLVHVV